MSEIPYVCITIGISNVIISKGIGTTKDCKNPDAKVKVKNTPFISLRYIHSLFLGTRMKVFLCFTSVAVRVPIENNKVLLLY